MQNLRLEFLSDKVLKLPNQPGVYIMRNKSKEIIYIGKAKVLKHRVTSYFRSVDKHTEKTYQLVENIYDFDYIVTSSEFEALVLEASMIKQYKPKYNILLKDDKGFNYIKISNEPYPRITAEKSRTSEGKHTFLGPYTSSMVVTQTVEWVNLAFKLPTCKRKFPEDFRKQRPCLNFHIKRCMGTCTGKISEKKHNDLIKEVLDFINNGSTVFVKKLEQDMETAAENLQFERAAEIRDRLNAIKRVNDEQNVFFVKSAEQDAIAVVQSGKQACFSVLKLRRQRLVDKQDYFVNNVENLVEARSEFLTSYYNNIDDIPPLVSIDGELEDHELIEQFLSHKSQRQVEIRIPQRGEKAKLIEMALKNAAQSLSHKVERGGGRELAVLDELARLIGMESPPAYIEAYDISNMGEETVVGGMIVFKNAKPLKSAYRKFNIKTIQGIDDYGSMREVISRRFARYFEEKDTNEGFGQLPDLILLDGGKGHVNAVAPLLEDLGLNIPLFGLVKDKRHRTRAIATDGNEIAIQATRQTFTLLSTIQDEVHRYTISHMKARRSKSSFTSELSQVSGIGPKRLQSLLRHFKTQKALRDATVEELAQANGMTIVTAKNLYSFFHKDE